MPAVRGAHLAGLVSSFWLCTVVIGCASTGPAEDHVDPGAEGAGGTQTARGAAPRVFVVRRANWPGGGHELTLRIDHPDDALLERDWSGQIDVSLHGRVRPRLDVRRTALDPGFTALLILPVEETEQRADLVGAIDRFVDSRPNAERIALFRWGSVVDQVGNFSNDPVRLRSLAARFSSFSPDLEPLPIEHAVTRVMTDVSALGGLAEQTMRAIVVLADERPEAIDSMSGVLAPSAIPVLMADPSAADSTLAASRRLDWLATNTHYTAAICGPLVEATGMVNLDGAAEPLLVPLAATFPEERNLDCDPASIGPTRRRYTPRIELVFSEDELLVYEARVEDEDERDFELGVRLVEGAAPLRASAHLRGATSLRCDRKSYTLDLEDKRHLLPGSYSDEFYLLSMCLDDRFVEQYTANQLLAELGLFPLAFRYVELQVNGTSHGVYLLLEKTKEELVRDNSRVRSVLRRRFTPPDEFYEVLHPVADTSTPLAAFDGFLSSLEELDGNALTEALETRLDLDRYLRWLAALSALQNGDYIDELFLVSSEQLLSNGTALDWYTPMGWDNDDLFSECHYSGAYAWSDPHDLAYCAEGVLEQSILAEPELYARFVDVLEELLTARLLPERFDAAVERTADDLLPFFEREEIAAAMTSLVEDNPEAVDPDEARRDIREKLDTFKIEYAERRELLLQRIAAYREGEQGEP